MNAAFPKKQLGNWWESLSRTTERKGSGQEGVRGGATNQEVENYQKQVRESLIKKQRKSGDCKDNKQTV